MGAGLNSSSFPDLESPVLDAKPLRCLAPMYPAPIGFPPFPTPNGSPYASSPMFYPASPSFVSPKSQTPYKENLRTSKGVPAPSVGPTSSKKPVQAHSPIFHSSRQPVTGRADADSGRSKRGEMKDKINRSVVGNTSAARSNAKQSPPLSPIETGDSNEKNRKRKANRKASYSHGTSMFPHAEYGTRESVERTLMTFDGLRRRFLQLYDVKSATTSVIKRADLKAGTIMMSSGRRTNAKKRIGAVPGVEIGDLFYFRFELCLIGLHAPSMGGIDYMSVHFDNEEEPLAISIVSSGVYEDDDMNDTDVLIYTGQGGAKAGKQVNDQKLERGNLALEKSSRRANEIRVIRGMKDIANPSGKLYIYDGLYKIQKSWIEKGKGGNSVFKYKLFREKGQPEASAIWKRTQQWKDNPSRRGFVILPDISSGVENTPVCLVNEADKEKGPSHFSYITGLKYSKPISTIKPFLGCKCYGECIAGDTICSCEQQNEGFHPYSSNGLLVSRKPMIYECCTSCTCSSNCRNRVTQKGVKVRLEVFKTKNRGWGLRSWDPIRAGAFICEYAGEVIDYFKVEDEVEDNDFIFEGTVNTNENYDEWNYKHELLGQEKPTDLNEISRRLSIIINAKNMGNVSRFMNHSCCPNVFWQPVLYDHNDENYPHIMFFALKHIPPMTELTYDYGLRGSQSGEEHRRQRCFCGSSKCRGYFG